jgi:hypothetical protein
MVKSKYEYRSYRFSCFFFKNKVHIHPPSTRENGTIRYAIRVQILRKTAWLLRADRIVQSGSNDTLRTEWNDSTNRTRTYVNLFDPLGESRTSRHNSNASILAPDRVGDTRGQNDGRNEKIAARGASRGRRRSRTRCRAAWPWSAYARSARVGQPYNDAVAAAAGVTMT